MTSPSSQPSPDAVCDGGDLDCGSGLLLIIRNAMNPLSAGKVLEVRSREISVKEDLPAWCRMVGHTLLSSEPRENRYTHYWIQKQGSDVAIQQDFEQAKQYQWQVRVRWTNGMQAKVFSRNHSFLVGQPASFDTQDPDPSAVEYLLGALGGCLTVGFQWRLSQAKIEVSHLELTLTAKNKNILYFLGLSEEADSGFEQITGTVYIDANAEEEQLQQLWEETWKRSPVVNTLLNSATIAITLKST